MCEFLSWIEMPNGELKYISNFELNTRDGKKLRRELKDSFYGEIAGHGAIKTYFGLTPHAGVDRECTDFSDPNNFPAEIMKKIKDGEFSLLAVAPQLLSALAQEKYKEVEASAQEKYKEVRVSAWEKYKEVEASAQEKYEEARHDIFWRLFENPNNRIKEWK